jgi:hypothetical protein
MCYIQDACVSFIAVLFYLNWDKLTMFSEMPPSTLINSVELSTAREATTCAAIR